MPNIPRVAVASLAVLVALTGCSKLGADAGSTTGTGQQAGDPTVAKIQRISVQQAQKPAATAAQVRAAVKAAAAATKVPTDLVVSVSSAIADGPEAGYDGCLVAATATKVKDGCVYGDLKATKTVVLYGDSHAGMWESAFDVAGKRTHTKVVLLAKPGCAVPELHFWLEPGQRKNTECDAWHTWATNRIVALKPAVVVLTSLFTGPRDFNKKPITEARWATGMTATLDKIKRSGAHAVVLGDMPYLALSAPECLAAHPGDVGACARKTTEAYNARHGANEKKTAGAAGATYVDAVQWLCSDVCDPIVNKMIVYQNQYHVSASYARYLSGVVASAVGMA